MKKITLSVAAILMAGLFLLPIQKTSAQVILPEPPPVTFGIKAGPSFSNMNATVQGDKENGDILVGLQGGVYANIPIAPQFYIQPSLMYEGKGAKQTVSGNSVKERLNYVTLPIDLLFKPQMPNGSGAWIVGVGPYFGYGISGDISGDGSSISIDPFKKGVANTDPMLKRFDVGANVQLGYEMASGLNLTLNANLGLINIQNNGDDDNSVKNTNFGVALGYTF